MEFFEKLGKKASATYKTAAEKTSKIASETKLKMKIGDKKSKIEDVYTEIGKKVYQKYVLDGELNIKNDIDEELKRINELSDEIKEYEKEILALSDMRECVNCKNVIDKYAKFCQFCGAKQPEEKIEEAQVPEIINENENSEETKTDEDTENNE